MKYTIELEISLPREKVIALFDDPDNLYKWQKGLISFEHLEGEAGKPGATSKLKYKMGKREIEMVETIVTRDLPDTFTATYEAKGVWNLVENQFIEKDEQTTIWQLSTEFKTKGFIRLLAIFAPGMFRKQTQKDMNNFKTFAERAS